MSPAPRARHGAQAAPARVDGRLKVTGAAGYTAELWVEGLVHGVIVGSRIARGSVEAVDTGAAEAAGGVLAVFSPEHPLPVQGSLEPPNFLDRTLHLVNGRRVDHFGQPVALVVAKTAEQAVHAASLVTVRYHEELARTRFDAAAAETPEQFAGRPAAYRRGDVDAALAAAEVRVEAAYTIPMHHHAAMEPHATVAAWEDERHVTVHDPSQGVAAVAGRLAPLLGIPAENIRVLSGFIGGGFGSKGSVWDHTVLAALAARELGRPVRVVLDRRQLFDLTGHRARSWQRLTLGAGGDGVVGAIRHEVVNAVAAHDGFGDPAGGATRMLYAVPNVETAHRQVTLHVPAATFMRAPGEAPGSFALECALDELAVATGVDPVELRLRNHADRDPESGRPWSSKRLRECYALAAERFGWAARDPRPRSMTDDGLLVGWGMATATYPAYRGAATARVRLLPDGGAQVASATTDLGTGMATMMATVAAAELGLAVTDVGVEIGDTRLPAGAFSGGSMGATTSGAAVRVAAAAARVKAVELAVEDEASPLYGAPESEVVAVDGGIELRGDPSRRDTYAAMLRRLGVPVIEATVEAAPGEAAGGYSMHAFGAQFVEVVVDPELLTVWARRVVACFDAGRILSPVTARGQLAGGIIQGIGMALTEEGAVDERSGRVIVRDLSDYHIPVHADIPAIDLLWTEGFDPYISEVGAKGIGEIGITGVAAAVANAVHHATGVRVRDLPITVERLLRAPV
ncbi:MAG: xanthine dehydrogenase YagR molybdenum-binding subunit [Chloroflexota bacterium]|nr:xanthine dehydrogenase YagR molybdenum-binding subunit [Chloroflexota bacterium]